MGAVLDAERSGALYAAHLAVSGWVERESE